MSRPRPVIAGCSYLITRRCTQRTLLMRPDAETNNAFIYCLAYAAERCGIEVLFTVAMSNHHHTGIHDRDGRYPEFLECFHKLFAKCQNALRGRWENFWSSEQTSVVRLLGGEDVLSKLVYAVCNPVQAALVEHALGWPGVSSLRATLEGRGLRARRPAHFFRAEGGMPEELKPRMAAKNKWRRVEGLLQNRRFQSAYRDARAAFQAGIKTVLFPIGTYWLKRFVDVVCEGTPYLAA